MMWQDQRAATLTVGAVTPAGVIVALDYFGDLRRVSITLEGGATFDRRFDDLVSVEVTR